MNVEHERVTAPKPAAGPASNKLSCYVLPGWLVDPSRAPSDAREAEALGLGTAWVSEKWDQKDASVLLGAMSQTTSRIRLGVAVTHPHTRHPMVLASFGSTLQAISGGRGILGFGRGNPARPWSNMGLPVPTTASLSDTATILKRLWAGETVSYSGPAGNFPSLCLNNLYKGAPPPLILAALGPKTLAAAGRHFDGAMTVPFLTIESVARMVEIVRTAARDAGRDPKQVRIIHPLVVAPGLPPERQAAVLGGRLVRYFQHKNTPGSAVPALNGWDATIVEAVRSHPILKEARQKDRPAMRDDLLAEIAAELIPDEWLKLGGAMGSPAECARRVRDYFDVGVDEVLLHGCTPQELGGLVRAFEDLAS